MVAPRAMALGARAKDEEAQETPWVRPLVMRRESAGTERGSVEVEMNESLRHR